LARKWEMLICQKIILKLSNTCQRKDVYRIADKDTEPRFKIKVYRRKEEKKNPVPFARTS